MVKIIISHTTSCVIAGALEGPFKMVAVLIN
jgi:hypothetical protein